MRRSSSATPLVVACVAVAALICGPQSAIAANYTWATLSGTGNWTDSVNWSGTSATNLYPGSVGSGTTDGAFVQAIYTSSPTINLDTSVTIRQLNLGGSTGATTFPVTLSTANASTITFAQTTPTGTSILAVNAAVNSGTNLLTPNILLAAATVEARMASVTSGTVNLAVTGNVSAVSAGNKFFRYTPNNTSTTTDPSILDFRGTITDGSGTMGFFYRNDMPNSVNTLKLSGTGNTFTGGINFTGGKPNQSILEASPVSGSGGALSTGLFQLGTGGSSAALTMGGSLSTVTEVCGINVAASGAAVRRIAVIGAGNRILSGTLNNVSGTSGLTLACTDAGNLTLSNVISGTAALAINSTGAGKVIFSGNNTSTGPTNVTAGVFQLDGSLSGSSSLAVATAGILGGTGTAGGTATIAGTLSPGSTTGVLTLGSLTLTATSSTLIDLLNAGTRGTDYDGVSVLNAGGLTYGGTMSLAFGGSPLPDNTTFNVFSFTGSPSGSFGQVSSTGFYAGTWTDNLDGSYSLVSGSQAVTFTQATGDVIVTLVPEPTMLACAGIGAAVAASIVRRRSRC